MFGSGPYVYSVPTTGNMKFMDDIKKRWSEIPHYSAGFAYVQMQIYEQAIKHAGSLDRDKIKEALETLEFDTIIGKIRFERGFLLHLRFKHK